MPTVYEKASVHHTKGVIPPSHEIFTHLLNCVRPSEMEKSPGRAIGLKYKPSAGLELGLCYEIPLTNRKDLMQDRVTADLILRY